MSGTHYFVPYDGDVKRGNGTVRKKQFRIVWYCENCAHDVVVEGRPNFVCPRCDNRVWVARTEVR